MSTINALRSLVQPVTEVRTRNLTFRHVSTVISDYVAYVGQSSVKWTKVHGVGPKYRGGPRNIRYRGTIGHSNVTYLQHIRRFRVKTAKSAKKWVSNGGTMAVVRHLVCETRSNKALSG